MMNEMFGITQDWINRVKEWEGFRSHAYVCPANFITQAYGRRVGPAHEDSMSLEERRDYANHLPPVTEAEGTAWLLEDLQSARDAALAASPSLAKASEPRVSAVADFCFNIGPAKYKSSTMKQRVDAKQWDAASYENGRWTRGSGKILPGLVKRRRVTSKWLMEG